MTFSLYDATVPVFIRGLGNMAALLDKGRGWADDQHIAHADLLDARLYPDMHPLTAQVQRASDSAKFAAARLGAIEAPSMADTETSFADLRARIDATIAFLEGVPSDAFDGREDAEIVLPTPNGSFSFTGRNYVQGFAVPNFYFHVTTAYALLRMKGVPIGKRDYLGGV